MKSLVFGATCALALAPIGAAAAPFSEFFPEIYAQFDADIQAELDQLDLQQGEIGIGDGLAQISVPEGFYYLDGEDARFVLEVVWGNPESLDTLGMIFPMRYSPVDQIAWGVEITYEDIGHVSDEDASDYDYDELLETMQSDVEANNDWRVENGYGRIDLIGWATEPHYNADTRELYWAEHLRFEGGGEDTLNFKVRELGREGVLVVNFIAGMSQLPEVEEALPEVLSMVSFAPGNLYSDYNPNTDRAATLGIGGLIAGGALLSRPGLIAAALLLLKKFWFVLLLPLVWLGRFFNRGNS